MCIWCHLQTLQWRKPFVIIWNDRCSVEKLSKQIESLRCEIQEFILSFSTSKVWLFWWEKGHSLSCWLKLSIVVVALLRWQLKHHKVSVVICEIKWRLPVNFFEKLDSSNWIRSYLTKFDGDFAQWAAFVTVAQRRKN